LLPELTNAPLFLIAAVLGGFGVLMIIAAIVSFIGLRLPRSGIQMLIGLPLLALGGLAGTISVGMTGYQVLAREDVAARIVVTPAGPQRFTATIKFPDGREATYQLAGDEIYVDAHILKWNPYANMLGLHTAYELDRVAGRYHDIKQEESAERTVRALAPKRTVDLYALRRRYEFLSVVLDADYGSATFVPVTRPAELELRVSTTGLLMREVRPR